MKRVGLLIGATIAVGILVALLWSFVLPFFVDPMIDGEDLFPDKYETGMILPPAPTQAEFAARRLVVATGHVDAATVTGRAMKIAVKDALFAITTPEQE